MDNLGAIAGPLLAIGLIALVSIRTAIFISVIPGLLSAIAIIYAIRRTATPKQRRHQRIRITVRPLLRGPLGRLMIGMTAFEIGNCATTLLIRRPPSCSPLPRQDRRHPDRAVAVHRLQHRREQR